MQGTVIKYEKKLKKENNEFDLLVKDYVNKKKSIPRILK